MIQLKCWHFDGVLQTIMIIKPIHHDCCKKQTKPAPRRCDVICRDFYYGVYVRFQLSRWNVERYISVVRKRLESLNDKNHRPLVCVCVCVCVFVGYDVFITINSYIYIVIIYASSKSRLYNERRKLYCWRSDGGGRGTRFAIFNAYYMLIRSSSTTLAYM